MKTNEINVYEAPEVETIAIEISTSIAATSDCPLENEGIIICDDEA